MLPSSSLAARRPGRRLLTPDIREYQAVAATYAKLPPGVSSGSLIHIARQAAVIMGLPPTAIVVLDALWSYTQPIDWLAPSRPLVWPSNETLCN